VARLLLKDFSLRFNSKLGSGSQEERGQCALLTGNPFLSRQLRERSAPHAQRLMKLLISQILINQEQQVKNDENLYDIRPGCVPH